jgi:hypothetical protein
VRECRIDVKILRYIESICDLKELTIENNKPGKLKVDFSCFPLLNFLDCNVGLRNKNFDQLLMCQNLAHLNITGRYVTVSQVNIIKLLIQQKYKLKTLALCTNDLYDDTVLQYISECNNISKLRLLRCEGMTDFGLKFLCKLQMIQSLHFCDNDEFTAEGLMELFSNMVKLMSLHLETIEGIDVEVLDVVAKKCPYIKNLTLESCPSIYNKNTMNLILEKFSDEVSVCYNSDMFSDTSDFSNDFDDDEGRTDDDF